MYLCHTDMGLRVPLNIEFFRIENVLPQSLHMNF